MAFVREQGLEQINDESVLLPLVTDAIDKNPKSVADYKKGKPAAAKAIVGQVMAKTGGRANPVLLSSLVEAEIQKR